MSTIQGNFLSPKVQDFIKKFLHDQDRGRPNSDNLQSSKPEQSSMPATDHGHGDPSSGECEGGHDAEHVTGVEKPPGQSEDKTVDVVLSDMFVLPTNRNAIPQE